MKNLIRGSIKLSFAVALPLVLFGILRPLPQVQELLFGLRATATQYCGTPAQLQALVNDTARESAARAGTLEAYLAGEQIGNALRAVHGLDARDPRAADWLFEVAGQSRKLPLESCTDVAPECPACKCAGGGVK